ncbi:MAG: PAS domain-containing protein, partial [Dehalococcoidales bacterium]|nr:PAS domain-containing protein [Dehalococcoidales bacterium]
METKEAIKQLESRIFQWKIEGSDKIRKDKLTLSSEDICLLIEDLTLKNVQTAEIEGLNKEIIGERQKYQELFNSFPSGYLTTDEECRIKEANLACAQILGVERDLLVSRNFGQFIAPDSHSDFGIFYGDLLRTAARQTREVFLKNNS